MSAAVMGFNPRPEATSRIVPALFLFRQNSPSNVGQFHVRVSVPRLRCLETPLPAEPAVRAGGRRA